MKKIISILLALTVLFSSCASILNGQYQKVVIKTSPGSKILVDGTDPLMKKGMYMLKRDDLSKKITSQKEGFKDEDIIVYQHKKSPLYILSFIPFGILLFCPPMYDYGKKAENYDKEYTVIPKYELLKDKSENEKEIQLNNLSIKLDSGSVKYRHFSTYNDYNKNKDNKTAEISDLNDPIKIKNTIFSTALNEILKEKGYIDTTHKALKNSYLNNLIINSEIKEHTLNTIGYEVLYTNLVIEWEILDYYKKSIYTKTTNSTSSQFKISYKSRNNLDKSIKDALENGFIEFMKSDKVIELLNDKSYADIEKTFKTISIDKSNKHVSNLGEAISSSVTIKNKDGHGSGFIISENGYIITNYHVITDTNDLMIILNDGREFKPQIIRENKISDLALIKIEAKELIPFSISKSKDIKIATDIYAVGTPSAEDLSQTISKGIISGIRKKDGGSNLIQTDASINGGNSGGAIVSKTGFVLGVVSSKLMGVGVEGVAFGIPAYEIFDKLKIEYK